MNIKKEERFKFNNLIFHFNTLKKEKLNSKKLALEKEVKKVNK